MKKASYKYIIHLYILFFLILAVIFAICCGMLIYVVSTVKPDGKTVLNKWPIDFTQDFSKQIVFGDKKPQVTDEGLELLAKDDLWLQVIDENGREVLSYEKPSAVAEQYSASELLEMYMNGGKADYTPFIGIVTNDGARWTYIIGFPIQISKVTIYVDTNRFTSGKPILLGLAIIAAFIALLLGGIYGLWITRQLFKISKAVRQIASRSYMGIKNKSVFGDVFDSLNTLDEEIRASDEERKRNEIMREEWIANITHDLKTPLSPIKGYAELLADPEYGLSPEDIKKYGAVIAKNTAYAEALVNDLKLTYQLKNEMIAINRTAENITRFLKEIIIDILNNPEYADRCISFIGQDTPVSFEFDHILMQRAFNNILYNAIVHNPEDTVICVSLIAESGIQIQISDNGRGMGRNELEKLFDRYYRGTNSSENVQGTGLGMAIAKQVIEFHGASIHAESESGAGTVITINFPSQT